MLLKNIIKIWRNWVFVEYKVHVDVDYSRNASCAINMISTFLLLSLGLYLCWRTIILHYHWAYTSAGGLLFSTITGPIPLLEDYYSPRVSSTYNHVIIIKTTILRPEA
jgi:hypothetical protein